MALKLHIYSGAFRVLLSNELSDHGVEVGAWCAVVSQDSCLDFTIASTSERHRWTDLWRHNAKF